MNKATGYEKTLESKAVTAINDLFADIEGRNLNECIAQFQRVQDHLTARITDLQCDSGLHGGN